MQRMIRIGLVALAALAAGCGGGGKGQQHVNVTAPAGAALGALTTGTTWTYQVTDPTVPAPYQKQVVVTGPAAVPGSGEAAVIVTETIPAAVTVNYYAESQGLMVKYREEDSANGVATKVVTWSPDLMKYLANAAPQGWTFDSEAVETTTYPGGGTPSQKDVSYRWTVLAEHESVTVPAGTFDCVKAQRVNLNNTDKTKTYWFAPGVGKIREEGPTTEELTAYQVK